MNTKCSRKNECGNYPGECAMCMSMNSPFDQFPRYRNRDLVRVVRCKDCVLNGLVHCPLTFIEKRELIFINHDPEFYCAYGEREGEDNEQDDG